MLPQSLVAVIPDNIIIPGQQACSKSIKYKVLEKKNIPGQRFSTCCSITELCLLEVEPLFNSLTNSNCHFIYKLPIIDQYHFIIYVVK